MCKVQVKSTMSVLEYSGRQYTDNYALTAATGTLTFNNDIKKSIKFYRRCEHKGIFQQKKSKNIYCMKSVSAIKNKRIKVA